MQYQNTRGLMLNKYYQLMLLVWEQKNSLVKQENTEIDLGINKKYKAVSGEEKIICLKDYTTEVLLEQEKDGISKELRTGHSH